MEYDLRGVLRHVVEHRFRVLILILMEYDLRWTIIQQVLVQRDVLILILMEYDLRGVVFAYDGYHYQS